MFQAFEGSCTVFQVGYGPLYKSCRVSSLFRFLFGSLVSKFLSF
jgi:hypothetical protein